MGPQCRWCFVVYHDFVVHFQIHGRRNGGGYGNIRFFCLRCGDGGGGIDILVRVGDHPVRHDCDL